MDFDEEVARCEGWLGESLEAEDRWCAGGFAGQAEGFHCGHFGGCGTGVLWTDLRLIMS